MKNSCKAPISLLTASLKQGDAKAYRMLFELFEKKLTAFVFTLTKSQYVTEEVLQEVFIKIWEKREQLDDERSLEALVFTIAKHTALNHLKQVARRQSMRQELWENLQLLQLENAEHLLIAKEYEHLIDDILAKLPERKRSVFILSKKQGRSHEEIAAILDISPKTVRNQLSLAMQQLRDQLRPYVTESVLNLVIAILCAGIL